MGKDTKIEWADSTANPTMGCDGCELWSKDVRSCYAGRMIDGEGRRPGMAGNKGWPVSFNRPAIFPQRIAEALSWGDLTGKKREGKSWLDGLPRMIFWCDLGDPFTPSLPLDWLAPHLEALARSPHQHLFLSKWPSRMAEFSVRYGPLPANFWPGTSVTSRKVLGRLDQLRHVRGGGPRFVSVEPALEDISLREYLPHWRRRCTCGTPGEKVFSTLERVRCKCSREMEHVDGVRWVIWGGESGAGARLASVDWPRRLLRDCEVSGVAFFMKQTGGERSKGGALEHIPEDLRVRRYPIRPVIQAGLF